uniref:cytochrome c oxidase subunit II n=1 Tax=Ogmocotyle ailuri TaxID=2935503 RepID=UPI0023AB1ED3|nr:cytochrome c oxidase subunit II [Ogmocotyle ailuri]WCO09240.1 cytochrome c oxidase subunit II [Ogmocotyle ailuri]
MLLNLLYLELLRYVFFICSFIPLWVFIVLICQVGCNGVIALDYENRVVELVWTVVPTLMVSGLCFLNLQYLSSGCVVESADIVKVVGRQWYWNYEFCGEGVNYDSFMTDFVGGVDKPLRLSVNVPYHLLITSNDVIHSFSLPEYNLKMDGVPGRINQIFFCPERLGVFVGYCSELCGAGHAYMPIVVEVVK